MKYPCGYSLRRMSVAMYGGRFWGVFWEAAFPWGNIIGVTKLTDTQIVRHVLNGYILQGARNLITYNTVQSYKLNRSIIYFGVMISLYS